MAQAVGMSPDSVHRIWKANDIKPHLTKTFKVSNDKRFEEKFWDVIGLYLDPPEKALVLCCDEKCQCQALERSQPGLPLGVGELRTRTHDYKRHGTITLFAALNYLDGKLIARTEEQHTHVEWLRFLKQIDRETPKELDLHLIVDNYSTHKEDRVKQWLSRHRRFHLHFTPTSSSWLNLIERFFGELTQDVIRDGSFTSVKALVKDIESYLAERNRNPKPYKWKARGEDILRKIQRARQGAGSPREVNSIHLTDTTLGRLLGRARTELGIRPWPRRTIRRRERTDPPSAQLLQCRSSHRSRTVWLPSLSQPTRKTAPL